MTARVSSTAEPGANAKWKCAQSGQSSAAHASGSWGGGEITALDCLSVVARVPFLPLRVTRPRPTPAQAGAPSRPSSPSTPEPPVSLF